MGRPGGGEKRGAWGRAPPPRRGGQDLPPAEHVAVEADRTFDVAYVKDDVPEFFDLHAGRSSATQTPTAIYSNSQLNPSSWEGRPEDRRPALPAVGATTGPVGGTPMAGRADATHP